MCSIDVYRNTHFTTSSVQLVFNLSAQMRPCSVYLFSFSSPSSFFYFLPWTLVRSMNTDDLPHFTENLNKYVFESLADWCKLIKQKMAFCSKDLYFFYFNIQSWKKNWKEFSIILSEVKPKLNIMILTEVNVQEAEIQLFTLRCFVSHYIARIAH